MSNTIQAAARGQYIAFGQQGDSVKQVQAALKIAPTGQFDASTLQAVRTFQSRNGCTVDGIVGPETLVAMGGFDLDQSVIEAVRRKKKQPTSTPQPSPTAPSPQVQGPSLAKVPRPQSTSGGGSAFVSSLVGNRVNRLDRESAILAEVEAGHVPKFITQWVDVPVSANGHTGIMRVSPDYFALGTDTDFVRTPMALPTAEKIAKKYGATLPTPKMVDEIYDAAKVKLSPKPMTPGAVMMSTEYLATHNDTVQAQVDAAGAPLGTLTAGHKKDLVLSARSKEGRVTIYGWQIPATKSERAHVIQGVSTVHEATYADYSHGLRLVKDTMLVDGKEMKVDDVRKDPELACLISNEGPVAKKTAG